MTLLALPACWAQKWELGVLGGGGFYTHGTATSPAGSGDVGFKPGAVVAGYLGNNMYKRVGGELRFDFQPGQERLKSSGTEVTFDAQSYAIHYDFLFHFTPTESHVRPFVAAGGGVKIYRGTGTETATQPLSRIALLTKTYETAGLGSVGAGFKVAVSPRLGLRVEVHDYITPFPKQVIASAPGGSISGILHDFVVMGGIAYTH